MEGDQQQKPARSRESQLAADISDAMVRLHRGHFGRGPANARTLLADHMVVCILSDVYTPVEKTLLRIGKADIVRETRLAHQLAAEREFVDPVEELTGRRVESFASSVTFDPDQAIEIFLLSDEAPSVGNG